MFVEPFVGFALGDAFGAVFEGLSENEVKIRLKYFEKKGKIVSCLTDDTIQMLTLAKSLISTIYFNPSDFADRLKEVEISRIGPTSSKAIERLRLGYSWRDSGINSNTCGSAMRVMPIGLLYSFNSNLVEEYAVLQSIITHKNKEAIAASVALALAYSYVFRNKQSKLEQIVDRVREYDVYTSILIERALDGEYVYKCTNLAFDVVSTAIQCYLYSENYSDCILNSVKYGGDTDSIAAIAGGLKALECKPELPFELDVDGLDEVKNTAKNLWKVYKFIR